MNRSSIEALCRPILLLVCQMRRRCGTDNPPELAEFTSELNRRLDEVRTNAQKNPVISREYVRIEKSLFFFIDYVVTAGPFPFAREWRPLARKFQELSGDEKFFDMLTEALEEPDSDALLEEYFYIMALGFDGVHRNDPGFIERKMRVCLARFASGVPPLEQPLSVQPEIKEMTYPQRKFVKSVSMALLLCLLFAVGALITNFVVFYLITREYRTTLNTVKYLSETDITPAKTMPEGGKK